MRHFRELIYKRGFPFTLESPLVRDHESLYLFIDSFKNSNLDKWILGINILNNPLGKMSPDPIILGGIIQEETGVEAIPHIVSSVENKYTLIRWLLGASFLNINNLLLMSGDIKISGCLSYNEAVDIINMFSKGVIDIDEDKSISISHREFFIGGVIIPWRENEFSRVKYKLNNNIRFFQTQIVMNIKHYEDIMISLDSFLSSIVNYKIPILTGVIPHLNKNIMKILDKSGVYIESFQKDRYMKHVKEIISRLFEFSHDLNNIILGVHLIPILWNENVINSISKIIEETY